MKVRTIFPSLSISIERIYETFLDAGKLSGDDAARNDVVIEEIAKCDVAIAGLSGNYQ